MDSEPSKQNQNSDLDAYARHVFQSPWIRYSILRDITSNRFVCSYNFYFLPIISSVIWFVFLFF
jgi:hypothetical protein